MENKVYKVREYDLRKLINDNASEEKLTTYSDFVNFITKLLNECKSITDDDDSRKKIALCIYSTIVNTEKTNPDLLIRFLRSKGCVEIITDKLDEFELYVSWAMDMKNEIKRLCLEYSIPLE